MFNSTYVNPVPKLGHRVQLLPTVDFARIVSINEEFITLKLGSEYYLVLAENIIFDRYHKHFTTYHWLTAPTEPPKVPEYGDGFDEPFVYFDPLKLLVILLAVILVIGLILGSPS